MKRLLVLLLFVCAVPLSAATKTWNGSVSANWSDGGNWSDGIAPAAGDDLVFGPAPPHQLLHNDLPPGTAFHSVAINGPYSMQGNAFSVAAGISENSSGIASFTMPISLLAWQSWSGAELLFSAVDLGPYTLTTNGAPSFGAISGSGGLIINGMTSMTRANTYTGPTVVNAQGWLSCACWIPGSVTSAGLVTFGASMDG